MTVKISELPAGTEFEAGDILPIVQDNTTKKLDSSGAWSFGSISTPSANITTGNFTTITTSGRNAFGGTDGVVIPVGTTAQRDGSPVIGLSRFNTSLGLMEFYDGTVWRGFGDRLIEIGTPMGGGYFAGYISTSSNGFPTHYLIVAPKNLGESPTLLDYGPSGQSDPSNRIDGPTNTATLVSSGDRPAAEFCANLSIGGFTDWYLPARDELDVLYFSLKPTTENNVSDGNNNTGINPHSVPKRDSFFSAIGPPRQTNAFQFIEGNSEAFDSEVYWSSTQFNTFNAQGQNFGNGGAPFLFKPVGRKVRAVRRIPV